MWTPIFDAQREVRHSVVDGPDVIAGGDLAPSSLEFAARFESPEGAISGIRDRSTLVGRCHEDGWRFVREHNSSYPVEGRDRPAGADSGHSLIVATTSDVLIIGAGTAGLALVRDLRRRGIRVRALER